jgi:hypothetical protein
MKAYTDIYLQVDADLGETARQTAVFYVENSMGSCVEELATHSAKPAKHEVNRCFSRTLVHFIVWVVKHLLLLWISTNLNNLEEKPDGKNMAQCS